MYTPAANLVTDEQQVRDVVSDLGAMELVSVGPDGYPWATLLPVLWHGDRVVAHFARANDHWQHLDDSPVLLVATAPQAYVSPSWYEGKARHGRVVPTWNYESVQLRGRASVFEDPERLLEAVQRLTDVHEGRRDEPWSVADAPASFVAGQLRGIVGVEVLVEDVQAKAKLSQNRSRVDQETVVQGLSGGSARERETARRMAAGFDEG